MPYKDPEKRRVCQKRSDEKHRESRKQYQSRPEVKARHAESQKKSDEKNMEKRIAHRNSPEFKAKIRAYMNIPGNKERAHASARRSKERIRIGVLMSYGGRCVCCGEGNVKFLAMDHINGGGTAEIKKYGAGRQWYRHLRDTHPNHVQVLCHNCNSAKYQHGECPHKTGGPIFVFERNLLYNRIQFSEEMPLVI